MRRLEMDMRLLDMDVLEERLEEATDDEDGDADRGVDISELEELNENEEAVEPGAMDSRGMYISIGAAGL